MSQPTLDAFCPYCQRDLVQVLAASESDVTLTCAACGHTWTVASTDVPAAIRDSAQLAMLTRELHRRSAGE